MSLQVLFLNPPFCHPCFHLTNIISEASTCQSLCVLRVILPVRTWLATLFHPASSGSRDNEGTHLPGCGCDDWMCMFQESRHNYREMGSGRAEAVSSP